MKHVGVFALLSVANAHNYRYVPYNNNRCYKGHGGTPLDPFDKPMKNVTYTQCLTHCDEQSSCVAFARSFDPHNWRSEYADCYFLSHVNIDECEKSDLTFWSTNVQAAPPPLTGNIMYHLFEPKYTGLADKDAGDFKGDSGFIFDTFSSWSKGNPEASMESNIIEMSEVNVTGWSRYEECNAPGADGWFTCPKRDKDYCCTVEDPNNRGHHIPANHTRNQLPGLEPCVMSLGWQFGFPGWWYSFPKESQGITWHEKVKRRIAGLCLGNAWRKEAGGCAQCGTNMTKLDKCVADCVKGKLAAHGNVTRLQQVWDRVFADPKECPNVPFPTESVVVV